VPLAFDTTGLQRHDERTWFDPRTGDQVSLTYFDLEPDLPASLEELPLLRQRLAHVLAEAGTLVEAHVVTIDSVPALYQVVKLPIPGRQTGLMFVAALTVPKATGSVVLQVLCQEGNTSGIRESMVSAQIGFENCFPPHPYAPGLQGMLPWNVADDQRWDAQFPEHPLSRARAWAHRTIRTARVDPNFARLPPFRPTAQVPEPPAFGGEPGDSQRFAAPGSPAAPEPQPSGAPSDSQRFTPPGSPAAPEPQPSDGAQHPTAPDSFGTPPEPQTFTDPSDSQRFAAPDSLAALDTSSAPPEPQTFGGTTDSPHFAAPSSLAAPEPQTFGAPADSQRSTTPDPFSTPPEPQTFGDPTDSPHFAAPGSLPEPEPFAPPTDSQHFAAPGSLAAPEPQAFAAPPPESRFNAPAEPHAFDPPAEPRSADSPPKPRPFPAAEAFDPPAEQLDLPRKPRPSPVPRKPVEQQADNPPESVGLSPESQRVALPAEPELFGASEPEPVDAAPEPEPGPFASRVFSEPEPRPVEAPPPPTAAGDVLHTVLVGIPIGDYLPLWQRDGQEDTVTFWRMSDPDAVRARLGTGVESRSAVDTGRYREAAMFSPERQMLFLMDRFRDDSGNLGGTSEQLFPATEEEAYQAADDKALSVLYSWLGDVVLAAVRRGEFVAVETGGWDVPVNPVVLVMLRTDGRDWHSVVETSPVPVGAPVWRDQQPVEGTSQILASPATDQTLRASGLLTRFAINTWSMHPFQLGISFGPNPTLEER
jgi:hypothetical protein